MEESRTRVHWQRIAQALLLVLLPCACYWPALDGAFLWDDDLLITKNPLILAADGLRYIWFSTRPYDYYPVTNSVLWLEWHLWGPCPLAFHLVSLTLHVTSAFLLWGLLRTLRVPGAWLGAVLFAVHPVNVAAVAWVAELKTVLAMVFYLGSLLCYVRLHDQPARANRGPYAAALALHVLAVLSKPSVVMMPAVLLVLGWWRTGRVRGRDLARTAPFFAVSLAAGLATMWFQAHGEMSAENLAHANPLPIRVILVGRTILFYLGKLLWPESLAMIYPRWTFPAGDGVGFLWPAALAALVAGAWWGRRRWGRGPAAALASFVLILLPVCGLLHMAYYTHAYVSDHLVYAATPGLLALVAASLAAAYARKGWPGHSALIVISGLAGLLSLGCWQRAGEFSSPEKLWRASLEVNPHAFAAHNNLGIALRQRGASDPSWLPLAEAHFREALKTGGDFENVGVNLAEVLRAEGRLEESAAVYRRLLAVAPGAESFNDYGVVLGQLGDNAGAREAFRKAIRLQPATASLYYNLSQVELADRHLPEACALLRACLRINPDDVRALTALLTLSLEVPDQPALPPPTAEALLALAERACQLTRDHAARPLLVRSEAALAAGRRGEAGRSAQQAHDAAVSAGDGELVGTIERFQRSLTP